MDWKQAQYGTAVKIKSVTHYRGHIIRCGILRRKALVDVNGWPVWFPLSELTKLNQG
jgi:hypothetical protein